MLKVITMTGALALVTGCAVGPDYQAPTTPEPNAFSEGRTMVAGGTDQQRFWQGFDDPLLARLIDDALAANLSLEGAVARYERAGDVPSGSFAMETPSEDEVKRRAEING